MLHKRYLQKFVLADLKDRMVFIGGPRQVGKTTLARLIGDAEFLNHAYLNWDNAEDRKNIIRNKLPGGMELLVFDEIHKYKLWKNYLKGLFDSYKGKFKIIVTGSARLDVYRRGGDSLFGRYHHYRLHPFSLAEAIGAEPNIAVFKDIPFQRASAKIHVLYEQLIRFGGFPEPFLKKDDTVLRRFHAERVDRLVKEDIRDLEQIRELSQLQILVDILPDKVGSLLSLNALREDLGVTPKTISHWADVLERFYYHFRIYPFASTKIKSLRKQPKLYLWDWSQVSEPGRRLENMVASHLLKFVHFLQDSAGYTAELFFLRDAQGREVDFLVAIDKKPWFAVEVKINDQSLSNHTRYFSSRLMIPFMYQVVNEKGVDFLQDGIRVMSADSFLSGLV